MEGIILLLMAVIIPAAMVSLIKEGTTETAAVTTGMEYIKHTAVPGDNEKDNIPLLHHYSHRIDDALPIH